MCRIKSGAEIINNEDIRNLVTGIILRQKKPYSKEHIIRTVQHYLRGSRVITNDKNISELVDNGLDILARKGEVACWNGLYQTAGIN